VLLQRHQHQGKQPPNHLNLLSYWQDNQGSQASGQSYTIALENTPRRNRLQRFRANNLPDNVHDQPEYQSNPWTALNEGHKQEHGPLQLW
jgi:hypothetical protein